MNLRATLASLLVLTPACGSDAETSESDSATSGDTGDGSSVVEPEEHPTQLRTVPGGTSMTKAGKNKLWMCPRPGLKPSFTASDTPWLKGTTVTVSKLAVVGGSVMWDSEFTMSTTDTERILVGNGLPNHATGLYPIKKGTDAYDYYAALPAMGYDNAAEIPIGPYEINLTLPRDPTPNAKPTCVTWIFQGVVSQTGGVWHAEIAPDTSLNIHDPISALPLDDCWGHPYNTQYHYHAYSWKCFPNQGASGEHSPLFGYAIDGFGVFGPRGENGELVSNDDLDECHGHTHEIEWDGVKKSMYHYHTNNQFPYTIGCYRGTPIELPHHLRH